MISNKLPVYKKIVSKLLAEKNSDKSGQLLNVYHQALAMKTRVEKLTDKNQTPFYLFDPVGLEQSIFEFKKALINICQIIRIITP